MYDIHVEHVEDAISKACTFMREQSHLICLYHLLPAQHSVKVLTGEATGCFPKTVEANMSRHQVMVV